MMPLHCPPRDHLDLHRTVVCHRWATLEEWVRNLDELADLSDAEIDDLARLAVNDDDADDA